MTNSCPLWFRASDTRHAGRMGTWAASSRVSLTRRAGAALACVVGLVLAGCSTDADTPQLGVDASESPTAMPVGTPTELFRIRAEQVSETLRRYGSLKRFRTDLLLLQPVMVSGGFSTDHAKGAFLEGLVHTGSDVDGAAGRAVLHPADGSDREVGTLGARAALELVTPMQPCGGKSQPRCGVTVTGAVRGTLEVMTNHGEVPVPVWRFIGPQLTEPLTVVAVATQDLASAPDDGAVNPTTDAGLLGTRSLRATGPTTLTVEINSGACDVNMWAHVWEADDVVVVGGTTSGSASSSSDSCRAVLIATPATMTLARPLAGRPVVDVISGRLLGPRS